ncbi:MAG: hypothetical protein JJ992_26275 [Planctomycetes bacterium]|nr:hypothetical protein [Planctomycetota bacterium]
MVRVDQLTARKEKVDAALAPVIEQIQEVEHEMVLVEEDQRQAQMLEQELDDAENSYERAMVHQECEELFGTGSPRKAISRTSSQLRRLERDREKLVQRAESVAASAARDISKLVIDGNNLCYQESTFIGLSALKSVLPVLNDTFDVAVVFDASIRSMLKCGNKEIEKSLGKAADVHVVATRRKADETVLDLAGTDSAVFVLSNDRYAEFKEKPAVRDDRVIRHEIVSNMIMIHDLGVSESFVADETNRRGSREHATGSRGRLEP